MRAISFKHLCEALYEGSRQSLEKSFLRWLPQLCMATQLVTLGPQVLLEGSVLNRILTRFCEKSWTETLLFQRREWPCSDTLEPLAFLQASKTATSGTPSGQQLTLYYSISQGYPLVIPNSGKTFRVTSLWRINCGFSYDQIPPPLICFGTQVQSASPNPLFTVAMESFKPDSLVPVQKSTIVKG